MPEIASSSIIYHLESSVYVRKGREHPTDHNCYLIMGEVGRRMWAGRSVVLMQDFLLCCLSLVEGGVSWDHSHV